MNKFLCFFNNGKSAHFYSNTELEENKTVCFHSTNFNIRSKRINMFTGGWEYLLVEIN